MKKIRQSALVLAILALASCGPLGQGGTTAELTNAATRLMGHGEEATPAAPLASADDMQNNPGQFIRVNFRDLGQWDTMVAAATNGARTTWIGNANLSVTFDDGIVVATRGLPRDLMGADAAQTRAAIRASGGTAERRHDFLDDMDQISTRVLQCSIASMGPDRLTRDEQTLNTTRFEERCTSELLGFTNVYWVDRDGKFLRSLQAVSPDAGYLQIDVF